MSNNVINTQEVLGRVQEALKGTTVEGNNSYALNVTDVLVYKVNYDLGNVLLGQLEELSYYNPDIVQQWVKYTLGVTLLGKAPRF